MNVKAKASAHKAIEATRYYIGSMGLPAKTMQRFYSRMTKAIEKAATDHGMPLDQAMDQIMSRARTMGAITPRPGKDY